MKLALLSLFIKNEYVGHLFFKNYETLTKEDTIQMLRLFLEFYPSLKKLKCKDALKINIQPLGVEMVKLPKKDSIENDFVVYEIKVEAEFTNGKKHEGFVYMKSNDTLKLFPHFYMVQYWKNHTGTPPEMKLTVGDKYVVKDFEKLKKMLTTLNTKESESENKNKTC